LPPLVGGPYVAAQLGHAKPTTTLAWYSHWLPNPDSNRFVDGLDRIGGHSWHQFGTKPDFWGGGDGADKEKALVSKGLKKAGARIRTADLLITNQLLYRLSYAST
jgi:hypothetical protein